MSGLQKQISITFFQTLEDLKSKENLSLFFADFLTEKEHESLIKRLAIAYWLHKKRDYENIKTNLNVTLKEIEEVEKKLDSTGYKLALKYMEAEEWANVWSEKIKQLSTQK